MSSSGQPDDYLGGEDCGEIWIGQMWNDNPCHVLKPFICERPSFKYRKLMPVLQDSYIAITSILATCQLAGYYLGRSTRMCYSVKSATAMSWADARADCIADGGNLASIDSQMEQDHVQSKMAFVWPLKCLQIAFRLGTLYRRQQGLGRP